MSKPVLRILESLIAISLLVLLSVLLCACDSEEMASAKNEFKVEKQRVSLQNQELSEEIKAAETLAATDETPLYESDLSDFQNAISDAKSRNDYPTTFDSGILASGSHVVIGTLVVRTSDELAASQQEALESMLIEALTDLQQG